jgi:cytochrome P450
MLSALVLGGFDTTASLITSGLIWLDENRGVHGRLLADEALMANAMQEFLRFWPPAVGGARNLLRDFELGGQTLRDGDRIFPSWAATNRDPTVFEAPHEVRIDRPNAGKNLTFGHGPHRRLGLELAAIIGQLAIRAVLERYPIYRIRREGLTRLRSHGLVAG